jgi:hypothetical protein
MTANVRAITIRQPYAWAIVKKGKRIENRTWSTKSREDLFIHAGVGYGDEQWLQAGFGLRVPPDPPRGAFVAMGRLVDVVTESDDRWFEGE